jgi:hypothetical protein
MEALQSVITWMKNMIAQLVELVHNIQYWFETEVVAMPFMQNIISQIDAAVFEDESTTGA